MAVLAENCPGVRHLWASGVACGIDRRRDRWADWGVPTVRSRDRRAVWRSPHRWCSVWVRATSLVSRMNRLETTGHDGLYSSNYRWSVSVHHLFGFDFWPTLPVPRLPLFHLVHVSLLTNSHTAANCKHRSVAHRENAADQWCAPSLDYSLGQSVNLYSTPYSGSWMAPPKSSPVLSPV